MTDRRRPGDTILVRHVWRGNTFLLWTAVVVEDAEVLVTWIAPGAPCKRPAVRDRLPYGQPLVDRPWRAPGVLQLTRPGDAHSVWVMPDGWYVNLQAPFRRTDEGIETADHLLDLVRPRDGGWRLKDEHELDAAVAAGYFTPQEAAAVRAEAERVVAADPVPTGWEDWRPRN